MLFRDFRAAAMQILTAETDAWVRAGPLGATVTVTYGAHTSMVTVIPRRILLPAPPDGGYTLPAWTVEAHGLERLYAVFGAEGALALLHEDAPAAAAVVRRATA